MPTSGTATIPDSPAACARVCLVVVASVKSTFSLSAFVPPHPVVRSDFVTARICRLTAASIDYEEQKEVS